MFRICDLDPRLQLLYPQWLTACTAQGLSVRGIQGWRDPAYQDSLKSQGISPLSGSESLHCCVANGVPASRAFDFGAFEENGTYVTDGHDPRYRQAGELAKGLGLIYGGDFKHPGPDWDHIQLAEDATGAVTTQA